MSDCQPEKGWFMLPAMFPEHDKFDRVIRSRFFIACLIALLGVVLAFLYVTISTLISTRGPLTLHVIGLAVFSAAPVMLLGIFPAIGLFWTAIRGMGADRVVIWLRRFHQHEPWRFPLHESLFLLGVSRFQVATIQDSRFRYSFLTGFMGSILRQARLQAVLTLPAFLMALYVVSRFMDFPMAIAEGDVFYPVVASLALMPVILAIVTIPIWLYTIRKHGVVVLRTASDIAIIVKWMDKIHDGIGHFMPGLKIFRCGDDFWMDAVGTMLDHCDAAIIDISDLNENMRWELGKCAQRVSSKKLILAYGVQPQSYPESPPDDLLDEIAELIGEEKLREVLFWPYPEPLEVVRKKPVLDEALEDQVLETLEMALNRAFDETDTEDWEDEQERGSLAPNHQ